MRNIIDIKDGGMFIDMKSIRAYVKRKLKNYDSANYYLQSINGRDLFVKKNGRVRVSTNKQYVEFMDKMKKAGRLK